MYFVFAAVRWSFSFNAAQSSPNQPELSEPAAGPHPSFPRQRPAAGKQSRSVSPPGGRLRRCMPYW